MSDWIKDLYYKSHFEHLLAMSDEILRFAYNRKNYKQCGAFSKFDPIPVDDHWYRQVVQEKDGQCPKQLVPNNFELSFQSKSDSKDRAIVCSLFGDKYEHLIPFRHSIDLFSLYVSVLHSIYSFYIFDL